MTPVDCGHEAYDVACDEYEAQPCCGFVTTTTTTKETP